jgi:hypothetical protein
MSSILSSNDKTIELLQTSINNILKMLQETQLALTKLKDDIAEHSKPIDQPWQDFLDLDNESSKMKFVKIPGDDDCFYQVVLYQLKRLHSNHIIHQLLNSQDSATILKKSIVVNINDCDHEELIRTFHDVRLLVRSIDTTIVDGEIKQDKCMMVFYWNEEEQGIYWRIFTPSIEIPEIKPSSIQIKNTIMMLLLNGTYLAIEPK